MAQSSAKFGNQRAAQADERVKDAGQGSAPDFAAVHAGREAGGCVTRGGHEGLCGVNANCGEDAVVASKPRPHANHVEEPGAGPGEKGRLEVVVEESLRFREFMPAEEVGEVVAAEMMKDTGGEVDVAGVGWGKGVAVDEAARKIFRARKASGFTDERGVEIHAHE